MNGGHMKRLSWYLYGFIFLILPQFLLAQIPDQALSIPPLLEFERSADGKKVFNLTAQEGSMPFFSGQQTATMGFNGNYLGPTIRVRRNDEVSIHVKNSMGESTTVHWHGADVPAEADGGPHQPIPSQSTWTAQFPIRQQAATLWYHPHLMGKTAEHVYNGLAGLFIIDDEISDALPLPREYGVDDIPLILQERRFERDGSFSYRPRMPDLMHGYTGNEILSNGGIEPSVDVKAGIIRLRLLNGSSSTMLRLSFEGGEIMHQIASDGGFLEAPLPFESLILSPGERAEILVDFTQKSRSSRSRRNEVPVLLAQSSGGITRKVLEFRVERQPGVQNTIPSELRKVERIPREEASQTRRFEMRTRMMGRMVINGKAMSLRRVDEQVKLGDTEIWEVVNGDSGSGMMNQPHNFHIHAVQFQVLSYNGQAPPPEWRGWKDTISLWGGDRVELIARFTSYPGLFMYHCHFLEHEDAGMMGQFEIVE